MRISTLLGFGLSLICATASAAPQQPYASVSVNTATTALAATSSASAAPAAATSLVPTSELYVLRTQLVWANETDKAQYAGLCVAAFHTGAALNDAVLMPGSEECAPAFLNNTVAGNNFQEFDLGNVWPYGFELGYGEYVAWSTVAINVGTGDNGMIMSGPGLISNGTEFGGWMACDWWHGQVQLFWKLKGYTATTPSSCAEVYLTPIPLSS